MLLLRHASTTERWHSCHRPQRRHTRGTGGRQIVNRHLINKGGKNVKCIGCFQRGVGTLWFFHLAAYGSHVRLARFRPNLEGGSAGFRSEPLQILLFSPNAQRFGQRQTVSMICFHQLFTFVNSKAGQKLCLPWSHWDRFDLQSPMVQHCNRYTRCP